MYRFNYHAPDSLEKARVCLNENEDAQLLAGGMTLLPTMKLRLASTSDLVDLKNVPGLTGIESTNDVISIGAMTCHVDVASSSEVQRICPAIAALAGIIGDPQVRNRGTIGGSLATNHPSADYPAAVVALGATVVTNQREIAAVEFFTEMFSTALNPGEIITQVKFPVPVSAAYEKFPDPASRYALVGVFVARLADTVRVAVTGAAECVFRATEFEQALAENFDPRALNELAIDATELLDDIDGSAQYSAHLINVLARRAVERMGS